MAELDMFEFLHTGRKELGLTGKDTDSVEELKLAALLGKTLLEKNTELEKKLRRLQEFAEETLAVKNATSRQLSESRDSLQFSIRSCEQLELKNDELEKAIRRLEKVCENKQSLVNQKSVALEDLEEDCSRLKVKYEQLQQRLKHNEDKALHRERANQDHTKLNGDVHSPERSAEVLELQTLVEELTQRVQKLSYQKQKAECELEEVLTENEDLTKNLERTEVEIAELQARFKLHEEVSESQTSESMILSPKLQAQPQTSTPSHGDIQSPLHKNRKSSSSEAQSGMSLFSELDEEYSTLRQSYDQLVQECTCSASLAHKYRCAKVHVEDNRDASTTVRHSLSDLNKPLKDLFDEVFHTLKQTAQVADRLIERRSTN